MALTKAFELPAVGRCATFTKSETDGRRATAHWRKITQGGTGDPVDAWSVLQPPTGYVPPDAAAAGRAPTMRLSTHPGRPCRWLTTWSAGVGTR
ncbi:hypothetical protein Cci01nite_16900 [Catellatospora citrea]|uniref:Uncharacterized protein n=1 Tax=Catellatospora citrea TaxID=53366 RepID=A0A8J3NYC2_9ACTN|nr:hypothetical protein Cci01nite_16900 [Catellatospora citrea]